MHQSFGSNYRLTELQAANGHLRLGYLETWIAGRRENAARLNSGTAEIFAIRSTPPSAREFHSYYKFYAFVRPSKLRDGWGRDRFLLALQGEGLPVATFILLDDEEQ